jgi:hypothetical protein
MIGAATIRAGYEGLYEQVSVDARQEARAARLWGLARTKTAKRVLLCATPRSFGPCKQRACPRCMRAVCDGYRKQARKRIRAMATPQLTLLCLESRDLRELSMTMSIFRRYFRRLRDRVFFKKNVRAGVGMFEMPLNTDGTAWNVHVHLVLDCEPAVARELAKMWKQIVGRRAYGDTQEKTEVRDSDAMAGYATKADTLDPDDDELDDKQLDTLLRAIKQRQLLIAFPTRGKRRKHGTQNGEKLLRFGPCDTKNT